MPETLTIKQAAERIGGLPKDIMFAGVVALTRMAKVIQQDIKKELPNNFTLRNNWIKRGIRITPATKQKQQSEVFTLDDFLALQDTGGTRRDRAEFWIPGKQFKQVTRVDPRKKVIPKKLRDPRIFALQFQVKGGLKGKGKPAKMLPERVRFKSGKQAIVVRRTSKSLPLDVIYLVQEKFIKIPAKEFFQEPAGEAYDEKFQAIYDDAFDQFVLGASSSLVGGLR